MKILSGIFILIGIITILNGFSMSSSSAIHQIYAQLVILTGAVVLSFGIIFAEIGLMTKKFKSQDIQDEPADNK